MPDPQSICHSFITRSVVIRVFIHSSLVTAFSWSGSLRGLANESTVPTFSVIGHH